MVRSAAVPVRTCIGCRQRSPKTDLIRVVAGPDGDAVPDVSGRIPGRGASLHLDLGCLDLAQRRRAFSRALRVDGPIGTEAVRRHVEAAVGREVVPQD